jgi:IclR family transcriptional regulator, pca regulon regulatory protein
LNLDEGNKVIRQRNSIQSLARGLNIMELFAKSSQPLTLTEIASQARLTKTTVQRFLNTLHALGYIKRGDNKRYLLSTGVLSLAYGFLNTSSLIKMAKPYLDELSSELSKTVNLAVLDDVHTICLYRKEVRRFLKFDIGPGTKLPCHAGSLGKVLLSGLNDEELNECISKIEYTPLTPKTILSKEKLREEVLETRKKGYAISDQELSWDMYSIAVPLFDNKSEMIAAINVSMEFHLRDDSNLETTIHILMEKGELICRNLGYDGPYPLHSR